MSAPAPAPSPPEPAPVELTEFYCYECESSVSLPVTAAHPSARRPTCPVCRSNLLHPGPPETGSPPPPPPGFLSGSEESEGTVDSDDPDELEDVETLGPAEVRLFISNFIEDRLHAVATPAATAAATAAAMSLLDSYTPGAEPPAPPLSITELPTIDVSGPDADCAICLQDLPPASQALMLPCSHLYHSSCIVPWLQRRNSCPLCRSRLPVPDTPSDLQPRITIRLSARLRARADRRAVPAQGPVSSSPTQLAQAVAGGAGDGPANSGETVSSEWPPQPDNDTVMSEPRDGEGFFD
ncbi:hypothetical protein PR202_ga21195 [Eleusine coracana subsp. coracana]|uniref:RING-type domain-containing protein n=1 Tax=Eleusine coracana subsp. coracana TaxID=191504 RepID=A0AAV5CYI2_ELECO|nr:hypothetical protein PR202_ga21195 [Eleusine coracana subsp. coracana]